MLMSLDGFAVVELAPDRRLERVEIEAGLHLEAVVEEGAYLEELVGDPVEVLFVAAFSERLDDERVELRVLGFLHPVMAEQALEQRIELAIVADGAEVMRLAHPLDH